MGKGIWSRGEKNTEGQINGFIDQGCGFEGKLHFEGIVQVNGEFKGEISSLEGTLIVGPSANINAVVKVGSMIVDGIIEGEVEAKTKVELRACGKLRANVVTPKLIIMDGGIFQGTCRVPQEVVPPTKLYVASADAV